jgi:hypothetical protein
VPHELAHAAAARLAGLEVCGMEFGSGELVACWNLGGLPVVVRRLPLGGRVFIVPGTQGSYGLRRLLTFAAGPASHLLLIGLAFAFGADAIGRELDGRGWSPLLDFVLANAWMFLASIEPFVRDGNDEPDGLQMLRSLKLLSRRRHPSVWEAGLMRVQMFLEAGRRADARDAFVPILRARGSNPMLRRYRFALSIGAGRFAPAVRQGRKMLEGGVDLLFESSLNADLAWALSTGFDAEAGDEAMRHAQRAFDLAPWKANVRAMPAVVQARYGDPAVARAVLEDPALRKRLGKSLPSFECALAIAHAREGHADRACASLARAEALDPRCSDIPRVTRVVARLLIRQPAA